MNYHNLLPIVIILNVLNQITSISSSNKTVQVILGKDVRWDLSQWVEDKSIGSSGGLSKIRTLSSSDNAGIILSGELTAPNAYYGQRLILKDKIQVDGRATGVSLLVDPMRDARVIPIYSIQIKDQSLNTYSASFKVILDTIEFKTYPQTIFLPFTSFKGKLNSSPFVPDSILEISLYVFSPSDITTSSNKFALYLKQISLYSSN